MRTMRVPRALFDWLTPPRAIAIVVIVGGGFFHVAQAQYRHGGLDAMVGVATLTPFVGLVVAAPVMALVMAFFGWTHDRTWTPWQGIDRAFDDRQVRVTEARDQRRFSAAHVHAAPGLPARPGAWKTLRVAEARHDAAPRLGAVDRRSRRAVRAQRRTPGVPLSRLGRSRRVPTMAEPARRRDGAGRRLARRATVRVRRFLNRSTSSILRRAFGCLPCRASP